MPAPAHGVPEKTDGNFFLACVNALSYNEARRNRQMELARGSSPTQADSGENPTQKL